MRYMKTNPGKSQPARDRTKSANVTFILVFNILKSWFQYKKYNVMVDLSGKVLSMFQFVKLWFALQRLSVLLFNTTIYLQILNLYLLWWFSTTSLLTGKICLLQNSWWSDSIFWFRNMIGIHNYIYGQRRIAFCLIPFDSLFLGIFCKFRLLKYPEFWFWIYNMHDWRNCFEKYD